MNFNIKQYKVLWYLVLAIFFSQTTVHGQHLGAKLTDHSVSIPSSSVLSFSLLDLSSTERGFLLPRMTTAERRSIPEGDLQQGLMIYNTTIDCMEFYNKTRGRWLNLCGEIEPATFVIQDSKCAKIQIEGNYFEGVFLKERANVIFLEVSVSTAGTYNIEATAYHEGNPNGYTFQGTGIFPEAGNYHLVLRGTGTPIKGYDRDSMGQPIGKGDAIKFVLNGKESSCVAHNFVEKESLTFKIVNIDPVGQFFTRVDLTDAKSGELKATVTGIRMGGTIEIHTLDNNGFSFSGRLALTPAQIAAGTAQVVLKGSGAPVVPRDTPLNFLSNSHVKVEEGEPLASFPYTVLVEPLTVAFDCRNAQQSITQEGEFEYNTALTVDHKIHVPVQVNAPGRGELIGTVEINGSGYGKQTEVIEFTSGTVDFVFNNLRDDIQNVVLTPKPGTGKPTVGNRTILMKFKLVSKGAHEYDDTYSPTETVQVGCDYDIRVSGAPVQYEALWDQAKIIGKLRPYAPANFKEPHQMEVPLRVIFPGEAIIETTNPVNGLTYRGTRILTDAEVGALVTITLTANGTPEIADNYWVELLGNSVGNAEQRGQVKVPVLYRPMTLLASGSASGYRIDSDVNAGLLNNPDYFGPEGLVKIEKLVVVSGNHTLESAFRTALRTNKVDIVVGSYNFGFSAAKNTLLYEFITRKRGVAMINNEMDEGHAANFITMLAGGGNTSIVGNSTYHMLINIQDPLLVGPFGDIRGKMLGEDRIGRKIVNLPPSYINYDADPSKAWAIRHSQHNFVYINDSGFMRPKHVYKVVGTAQKAVVAVGSGSEGNTRGDTYNSHFTMNFLAWAIDQVQLKTDEEYQF